MHAPTFYYSPEHNPQYESVNLLFICDHASNYIPKEYNQLGLSKTDLNRHIAYDIGAEALTMKLAQYFGACCIRSHFSRLLIDPNRGEDDPTLIMQISDGARVPGNIGITAAQKEKRLTTFYDPYHNVISREITKQKKKGKPQLVISIHSFTPLFNGKKRVIDAAILSDPYSHDICCRFLPFFTKACPEFTISLNQPYKGGIKCDTLDRHCSRAHIDSLLFEYRQDHIGCKEGIDLWSKKTKEALDHFIQQTYS